LQRQQSHLHSRRYLLGASVGCRVQGSGCGLRGAGLGFRVSGVSEVSGVWGLRFGVWGVGFGVSDRVTWTVVITGGGRGCSELPYVERLPEATAESEEDFCPPRRFLGLTDER